MAGSFMLPAVLHPLSRGSITLLDSDPHSRPIIDPNLLAHPHDRQVMKAGKRYRPVAQYPQV